MTWMSLFKIERNDGAGYDESNAFVVAAVSEDQARALLSAPLSVEERFDGGRGVYAGDEGTRIWADPTASTCEQIAESSIFEEPTVVLRDFHHG